MLRKNYTALLSDVAEAESIGLLTLEKTADNLFKRGENGIVHICRTKDRKVEFIAYEQQVMAHIISAMGYPAWYPVHDCRLETPVEAVLMDLDGTTVRSEDFWIWIIQQTLCSLMDNARFELCEADLPFVSGHSVSEHLKYGIQKYCPDKNLADARRYYFEHTRREMEAIVQGHGRKNAFTPTEGIGEFLLSLKDRGIRIGLVTSGLYEKAYPEILSAFNTLGMGKPEEFYDSIITAGFPLQAGSTGTLGELCPKPHPWLYAETGRVGLGIPFERRNRVVGIEDSAAGIVSIMLAGYMPMGIDGGSIDAAGTKDLCGYFSHDFAQLEQIINGA